MLPITTRFGLRLRSLRLQHKYTQRQLADYIGMDRSFISDVERGKKAMTIAYLEAVAAGFNMKLSELLKGL